MKKNIIYISLIASSLLSASMTFVNPLGTAYKSTDNGGTLPAIDAYKDGVGVMVLDNIGAGFKIDNSAMNTLVYKYGDTAKVSGNTITNQVLAEPTASNSDKTLANNISNIFTSNNNNSSTSGLTEIIASKFTQIPAGKKASFTILDYGLWTANGGNWDTLFDQSMQGGNTGFYLVHYSSMKIQINDSFRLWGHDSGLNGTGAIGGLTIMNFDTGEMINSVKENYSGRDPSKFDLILDTLPAGTYVIYPQSLNCTRTPAKFKDTYTNNWCTSNGSRMDDEWFFEKM